jgi:hypothetical protein|tara:strand:+ start:2635 stop:2763 length:129 start_codon:yes stop_codon:yes gene_type:complete
MLLELSYFNKNNNFNLSDKRIGNVVFVIKIIQSENSGLQILK